MAGERNAVVLSPIREFNFFEDKHFIPPELLCGEIEISMLYAKTSQKQMCPKQNNFTQGLWFVTSAWFGIGKFDIHFFQGYNRITLIYRYDTQHIHIVNDI